MNKIPRKQKKTTKMLLINNMVKVFFGKVYSVHNEPDAEVP